jgi:AbrB family looped-hinge helix DNA binding protein
MQVKGMAKYDKPELIVLSSKGQVVIPQEIRKKLGLKAKSQLLAFHYRDTVVLKKVRVPEALQEMQRIWENVDRRVEKYGLRRLSMREINAEVHKYRREKGILK